MEMLKTVDIAALDSNPFQSRGAMDKQRLKELADEIKENGFWEGTLRARRANGKYQLIFGHRRLAALRLLKQAEVKVDVVEATDLQMAQESLIENLQREGLTDPEIAEALGAARQLEAKMSVEHFAEKYAQLLGFSTRRIEALLAVASIEDAATKKAVAKAKMKAPAVQAAKSVFGEEGVKALAEAEIPSQRVREIAAAAHQAPRKTRQKIKERILKKQSVTAEKIRAQARRDSAEQEGGKRKKPDYDLMVYVTEWTYALESITERMKAAVPYAWYLTDSRTNSEVTAKFIKAAKEFVKVAAEMVEL